MSLEMPWRDPPENQWNHNEVMVSMHQDRRGAEPTVDLGVQVPKSELHPDEHEIWVHLTVEEATALRAALSRLLELIDGIGSG